MTKAIKEYKAKLDTMLISDNKKTDWAKVCEELTEKIKFYQHERLVHLIVTMTVSVMLVISVLAAYIAPEVTPIYFILIGLFLVLDAPYLFYYFMLENAVQDIYKYYDRVREKIG